MLVRPGHHKICSIHPFGTSQFSYGTTLPGLPEWVPTKNKFVLEWLTVVAPVDRANDN